MRAELFFSGGARLAEGPVWDDERRELLWVDIPAGLIHRTREDGLHDAAIDVGEHVGAVAIAADGRLVAAARSGFRLVDADRGHPLLAGLPVLPGAPDLRMNDGKCDPRGRFLAGTMGYNDEPGAGALWCLDGKRLTCLLTGVTISNGLAWSSDGKTLYYVDTPTQRIDAFDYDIASARLSHRRTEVDVPAGLGSPDGLTIDREGGLWLALWGGAAVHRYVAGRLDEVLEVPSAFVTSCAFGGEQYETLYITTAEDRRCGRSGAIFATTCNVAGGYRPARFKEPWSSQEC